MKKLIISGKVFNNLKGEAIEDAKGKNIFLGEFIANTLVGVSSKGRDSARCVELAMRLLKLEDIALEDSEIKLIESAINEGAPSVLFRSAIDKLIADAEDVPEDVDKKADAAKQKP